MKTKIKAQKNKYCSHCGGVMKIKKFYSFDKETGEKKVTNTYDICPRDKYRPIAGVLLLLTLAGWLLYFVHRNMLFGFISVIFIFIWLWMEFFF